MCLLVVVCVFVVCVFVFVYVCVVGVLCVRCCWWLLDVFVVLCLFVCVIVFCS